MSPLPYMARSLTNHCRRNSKPYLSLYSTLGNLSKQAESEFNSHPCRKNSFRSLILQSISQSVKIERLSDSDFGIIEVKLDRPEAKNAIGKNMLSGLRHSLEAINVDSSANVVMISSSVPRVFCAGADLKERRTMSQSDTRDFVNSLRSTFTFLEGLSIPTIAVIEGAALGGGLEMALSCDLRICGEAAVLGLPETGLAIIPGFVVIDIGGVSSSYRLSLAIPSSAAMADSAGRVTRTTDNSQAVGSDSGVLNCHPKNMCHQVYAGRLVANVVGRGAGGTQRLPRLVGKSVAKELIFTGRKIDARNAASMGLINYCVPSGEAHLKALEVARDINEKGPLAIRMAKRSVDGGLELDFPSALELEEDCYEQLPNTKDRLEGLAAFVEKRKPRYKGE
ncbi:hypothetical protein C5167_032200 [Papaver somniferum]|uniref:Enoyl-CoA hydratase n=1 Tax=Papaver somniferum TaxID=3469 RepID=A0A4Y7K700_PAPSO|nr:hypothetical protein C5167_032200 [Papaver somniferum]